jgi:hypothetical protein
MSMHSSTNQPPAKESIKKPPKKFKKKTPQQFENQNITCEFKVVEFPHVDVAWKP